VHRLGAAKSWSAQESCIYHRSNWWDETSLIYARNQNAHKQGFVHGDIRTYNTVFGEQDDQGYLIDFDFGGKPGTRYPKGCRQYLADGLRCGSGEDGESNEILPWHDWFALGRLIFFVHDFDPPEEASDEQIAQFWMLDSLWKSLTKDPTPEMLAELKSLLGSFDEQGWSIRPSRRFTQDLKMPAGGSAGATATNRGATGSPPEKKH